MTFISHDAYLTMFILSLTKKFDNLRLKKHKMIYEDKYSWRRRSAGFSEMVQPEIKCYACSTAVP